ncbi:MAG: hypothetical protein PHX51_04365 [Clostridia bacterium]|nr:hypothetical protein [Clostridia bacterium]
MKKWKIVVVVIASVLLLILLFTAVYYLFVNNRQADEIDGLMSEIERLTALYEEKKDVLEFINSVESLEDKARELGMIGEDETIWVLMSREQFKVKIAELKSRYAEEYNDADYVAEVEKLEEIAYKFGLIEEGESIWDLIRDK